MDNYRELEIRSDTGFGHLRTRIRNSHGKCVKTQSVYVRKQLIKILNIQHFNLSTRLGTIDTSRKNACILTEFLHLFREIPNGNSFSSFSVNFP